MLSFPLITNRMKRWKKTL